MLAEKCDDTLALPRGLHGFDQQFANARANQSGDQATKQIDQGSNQKTEPHGQDGLRRCSFESAPVGCDRETIRQCSDCPGKETEAKIQTKCGKDDEEEVSIACRT